MIMDSFFRKEEYKILQSTTTKIDSTFFHPVQGGFIFLGKVKLEQLTMGHSLKSIKKFILAK